MTHVPNSMNEASEGASDRYGGQGEASGREGEAQFAETVAFCEDQILRGAIHRTILNPKGGRR